MCLATIHMSAELRTGETEEMGTSDDVVIAAMTNAQKLATQVAGHMYNESRKQMGMLDLGNGLVLKPIQDPPRGTREMEFYQRVFDPCCTNPDIIGLRQFLPAFHGILETEGCKFLKLSNITRGFKNPSVLDIKVGKKTYDPHASAEKVKSENAKFPPALKLGYQFVGMLLYNPDSNSSEKICKDKLRSIPEERILEDGLGRFFGLGRGELRKEEIVLTLSRLKHMEQWMMMQRTFNFYASSLLLVYESQSGPLHTQASDCLEQSELMASSAYRGRERGACCCSSAKSAGSASLEALGSARLGEGPPCAHTSLALKHPSTARAEVHMIDFAHVFSSSTVDENYLCGLRSIMQHLKQLLEK